MGNSGAQRVEANRAIARYFFPGYSLGVILQFDAVPRLHGRVHLLDIFVGNNTPAQLTCAGSELPHNLLDLLGQVRRLVYEGGRGWQPNDLQHHEQAMLTQVSLEEIWAVARWNFA